MKKTFLFYFFLIILFSCSDENHISNNDLDLILDSRSKSQQGVKLFKELFFFDGLKSVKEVKVNSLKNAFNSIEGQKGKIPNLRSNINKFSKVLTDEIDNKHPEFFEIFYSKIKSDDPYKVKEAIQESALISREALLNLGLDLNNIKDSNELLEIRSKNDDNGLSKNINIYTEEGKIELSRRIREKEGIAIKSTNSDNALLACTPGIVICVVHTAAVVTTMAAVAAKAVALAAVVVKTAAVLWDQQWVWESSGGEDEILNEEILIADIIDAY